MTLLSRYDLHNLTMGIGMSITDVLTGSAVGILMHTFT